MKNVKRLFFLTAILLSAGLLQAQSVDDIIAKHVDAIGGKDKISQIKSISTDNTVQIMGSDNPSTTTMLVGKGYKMESEFNSQKIVQCYTDKSGWTINPFAGGTDAQAMSDDEYKAGKDQIYIDGALLNYAAMGFKAELLGKEPGNFKIKLSTDKGDGPTFYIDSATYLINKVVTKGFAQGSEVEITKTFSDYRKTDFGYTMAFKYDIDLGQFQLTYLIKKAEINKDIDPKVFEIVK